jgi:hypothetical protein
MRSSRDLGASARGTSHHDLQASIKIFQYPGGFRLRPGLTLASNCCAVAGGGRICVPYSYEYNGGDARCIQSRRWSCHRADPSSVRCGKTAYRDRKSPPKPSPVMSVARMPGVDSMRTAAARNSSELQVKVLAAFGRANVTYPTRSRISTRRLGTEFNARAMPTGQTRSKMAAIPWPPPIHIVTKA